MLKNKSFKLKDPVTPAPIPPKRSGAIYPDNLLEEPHGWLSPGGRFFPCRYGDHEAEAEITHIPTLSNYSFEFPHDTYTIILERHGWVKIQKNVIFYPDHVRLDDAFPVTQKQFQFINDFLAYHKVESIRSYEFRVKG